jgi:hypothetical protein
MARFTALILASLACHAAAHAEFLMADSSFRKQPSTGQMYCSAALAAGDSVMGKQISLNTTEKVFLNTTADGKTTVHFSGAEAFTASRGTW